MNITKLETYRKLKELSELGELRAKHYASKYRADELQQAIKGERHES